MDLQQCLEHCTWQHLWTIAYGRGLPVPRRPSRADLLALLHADLGRPGTLAAEVANLTPETLSALHLLACHDGWLPAAAFCQRFGPLRPVRRREESTAPPPWREPASTTERLYYRGLIYSRHRPRRRQERETAGFTLPAELIPLLPPIPALVRPAPTPASPSEPPSLLFNLTIFLAYLTAHACAPRQGRWLTPRNFRPLLDRLLPTGHAWITTDRRDRGETTTRVLRALHFLAEAARFLPTPPLPPRRYRFTAGRPARGEPPLRATPPNGGERGTGGKGAGLFLLPTLIWHHWLSLPAADHFAALRRALLAQGYAAEERWRAYRFPGGHDAQPLAPLHRLAAALREAPTDGTWIEIESFLAGLAWRSVELGPGTPPGDNPHRALLTGLLAWLGLVQLDHPDTPSCFRLSSAGAALLQGAAGDRPGKKDAPAPLRLAAHSSDEITLTVAPDCPPALLYPLAAAPAVAWPAPDQAQLTRAALAGTPDLELADLARLLDTGLAEPLPAEVVHTLHRWSRDGRVLRLRPALLLESDDPDLLADLAGRRGLRRHIHRTLGRRAVEVDAGTLPGLLRKLRGMGLVLPAPLAQGEGGEGDNAHLLLAARLFNRLPASLRGAPAIPQAALDRLAASLEPPAVVLAGQLAAAALERILAALDGRIVPAPPVRPAPAVLEQTLEMIRRALTEEQLLAMAYYTAGRNELTHRIVEPLRLEERGGVFYLVAYCRLRREERTFRVDRIAEITLP